MPYISEKIKLPKELDRRIKFTDDKKNRCDLLFSEGVSIRAIARDLKLSPRSIHFYLYPERLEESNRRRKERGGSMLYYNKKSNTISKRNHRRYKHSLYLEGKIK